MMTAAMMLMGDSFQGIKIWVLARRDGGNKG